MSKEEKEDKGEENDNDIEPPSFISFLSCVLARLAYVSMPHFTQQYIESINVIPDILVKSLRNMDDNYLDSHDIFDDTVAFKSASQNMFLSSLNGKSIDVIKLQLPQRINNTIKQKYTHLYEAPNENVKIIEILSSNGHKINIVADKRFNSIFVLFRGTSTFKAMTSWVYINKLISVAPCKSSQNKFLLGFFKLSIETIHIIYYSICDLATGFLQATKKHSVKIFTSGHSLGGGLATIFSYLWVGIREENLEGLGNALSSKIICIPIAAPKVLKEYIATHDYAKLIGNKTIIYKRIVINGDIAPTIPLYYTHPNNNAVYCDSTLFTKTKKNKGKLNINYNLPLVCKNTENKTTKYSLNHHGNCMYIYFIGTLKMKEPREVKQSEYNDTVVRIFISNSNNNSKKMEYNVLFLYLNDIRYGLARDKYSRGRNIRLFDALKKEDVYMNNALFKAMLSSASSYEEIAKKIKQNTKSTISEHIDLLTSYGRPMFDMGLAIKENNIKLKRRSVLCLTQKHMRKILRNKTKRVYTR